MKGSSWDKMLLVAVALAVVGIGGWFATKAVAFKSQFPVETPKEGNKFPETKTDQAEFATKYVKTVNNWNLPKKGTPPKPLPLFVSIPIVEINGATIDMLNPEAAPIRPPASNGWLLNHNLDYLSKTVLSQDPDGDGYSNLEEWNGKTDPKSSDSHPPYAQKIALVARRAQVYKIKFATRPDNERFQIQRMPSTRWPKKANDYLRLGEISEDKQIRLDSFEEKFATSSVGIKVDASVLSITFLPTGKKETIVRGIVTDIPTYFAELEFLLEPGKTFFVKEGDTFSLAKDPGAKYRVVKVTEDSATITYETAPGQEQSIEIKKK